MQPFPFSLANKFYEYFTLESKGNLELSEFNIIFSYNSSLEIFFEDGSKIDIDQMEYIILSNESRINYWNKSEGIAVCLKNNSHLKKINSYENKSKTKLKLEEGYLVKKPWGRELWLTGLEPIGNVVLKFIEIKAGTKTSLQAHEYKYESYFIVSGKAIFRSSRKKFQGKECTYSLVDYEVDKPYVFDVEPLTVHQVEAVTDIVLIEASTNHLDDVIRLNDEHGRGDGRIYSEHSASQ